jgi:hypothetical protein
MTGEANFEKVVAKLPEVRQTQVLAGMIEPTSEELQQIFPEITAKELISTLGLTIKRDEDNKLITFLAALSAYSESNQFNVSYNAPSSTGKSYIPLEIASLFPPEDIIEIGYCSPTAFFHDIGVWDKEKKRYIIDISRKVIVFLDMPHPQLLEHLRPLLSHDKKELVIKITDKSQKHGLRTKTVVIYGFPAVIFCSANLKLGEQEATRVFLLSPEISQEKIREAIHTKLKKEADIWQYKLDLERDTERQKLKKRILAIRNTKIKEVLLHDINKIESEFSKRIKWLKARHSRDIGRLVNLIKEFARLNCWHRKSEYNGEAIQTNDSDISEAFAIWDRINESQELGLPPYIFDIFNSAIKTLCEDGDRGVTRNKICREYYNQHHRFLSPTQLARQILPMLETAGLIYQEPDPEVKRQILVYLTSKELLRQAGGGIPNNTIAIKDEVAQNTPPYSFNNQLKTLCELCGQKALCGLDPEGFRVCSDCRGVK